MARSGKHHSTTSGTRVVGHSLVQGLYVVEGRHCPLEPQLYRQQAACRAEAVPLQGKIDLMTTSSTPVSGTQTDVLLNKWYAAKRLWKMTRSRGLQIMTGLKSNRHLRVADARKLQGWRRQSLKDYTTGLTKADYEQAAWPSQDAEPQPGPVHVLTTQVRKLFRCQVILVHETLDPPLAQVRFFA